MSVFNLFLTVLMSIILFSNSTCNRSNEKQQLCSEEVTFSKVSWLKEQIEFYNWEYNDTPEEEDRIKQIFQISLEGSTYFVTEFSDEMFYQDCNGNEIIDNSNLIQKIKNASQQSVWPIIASGRGGGGSW